ncbi:amidohydrolase [Leisingera sp. ANG-Vp]|uniref:amidohydrolase n=1 Tax=Leisingera sp. ANG-Vp TaxID=1577896 RepID=UPI0005806621|nr:amidohydrolase [Leisingera sp. ANG-Vp]KIC20142.1 amidohydrolase [Leisingera sp. ANG-Vp]
MPDIVILNGRIITFDGPDAEALAIEDGKITAVGSTAEIRDIAGAARVIDAQGGTVLPGFIDSHVHIFAGSAELEFLNLHGVTGVEALRAAVQPYAAARPDDQLLFACSIDYALMGDRSITRHDLDAAIADRPFAASTADHHTVYANTKALELAGLLHGKNCGVGSEVVMGPDGLAAGELLEPAAFEDIMALTALGGREMLGMTTGADPVPAPSAAVRATDKDVLAKGMKHCAEKGITGLHNMDGNFYQLELLAELEAEERLLCRTEIPLHLKHTDPVDRIAEAVEMRNLYQGSMLWSNRVKMFVDGVLDSKTAYMLEPYPGTDDRSEPLFAPEHFNEVCIRADAQNLQIAVHAIGDAAVRLTLDGYEAAQKANGIRDSRHRIEHIETIHPDDIPRLSRLGAVASLQPLHSPRGGFFPPYDGGDILHDHQFETAFAWKTIRDSGAKVVLSTDWPVVPVDPMLSIQGAVAGVELPAHWPEQRLGLRASLASYTRDNAWVEFNEHRKGRLKAGMMADIVVMDKDLEALEPSQLSTARAAVTICGGRITHQA